MSMKAVKLAKGERIVDIKLDHNSALVWGNPSALVFIASASGGMRTDRIQHEDMSPALSAALKAGNASLSEMIELIPTYSIISTWG